MGIIGTYTRVSNSKMDDVLKMDEDDLVGFIEEEDFLYDIDKMWDITHYLLTGESAITPIDGNPLSQAIMGGRDLFTEDIFISITNVSELEEIIQALKAVDVEKIKAEFVEDDFKKAELYPEINIHSQDFDIFEELEENLEGLINFYEAALKDDNFVLCSIY